MRLNAQQLRELEEKKVSGTIPKIKRNPIYFILENIYDTYNIGGLFRLADALAVEKIYLCGEIETPPNSRIKKASIGTYKVVPWEYKKSVEEAIMGLNSKVKIQKSKVQAKSQNEMGSEKAKMPISNDLGSPDESRGGPTGVRNTASSFQIIAVEQHPQAIPYTKADYNLPLALVFGNETYGVTPETLKLVDQIVEIPMWGINKSLNVIVSAAIVGYFAISKTLTV